MNEPFLYAGQPRIPPPSMQLRSRKEGSTRDTVNARFFEQWQSDGKQLVVNYYDARINELGERLKHTTMTDAQKAAAKKESIDLSGAKAANAPYESWQRQLGGDPSVITGTKLNDTMALLDMNPINTRTTSNDYRQSQPFVANGPQMGLNPYFDRYDPTFDPRNAIRELRSAVYEDRQDERGIDETRRILDRGFTSRWLPEGYAEVNNMNSLQSYEMLLPRRDDISKNYRGVKPSGV